MEAISDKLLIIQGKLDQDIAAGARDALAKLALGVNARVQNIFNGLLRVPVNEKIPALNSI
jgi:hypothetical protein